MITLKTNSDTLVFDTIRPISISRPIYLNPQVTMSGAFYLPKFDQIPFKYNDFIGDVDQGGSCNVKIQSFTPHNLTHIETSLHIVQNGHPISAFPNSTFQGLVYLVDLSENEYDSNGLISSKDFEDKWDKLHGEVKFLAIKTNLSYEDVHKDFSNTSPIALDPKLTDHLNMSYPHIIGLYLDLPSADIEDDGGKLLAHRNFFQLPVSGIIAPEHPKKFISELGYFKELLEGYYYCVATPPKIETDAVITDVIFFPLKE